MYLYVPQYKSNHKRTEPQKTTFRNLACDPLKSRVITLKGGSLLQCYRGTQGCLNFIQSYSATNNLKNTKEIKYFDVKKKSVLVFSYL
jgi:hypothetical protein